MVTTNVNGQVRIGGDPFLSVTFTLMRPRKSPAGAVPGFQTMMPEPLSRQTLWQARPAQLHLYGGTPPSRSRA